VGAGTGGADAMKEWMAEDEVMWALLRISVGEGDFERKRMVFIHFCGTSVPPIRRGKTNEMTAGVMDLVRGWDGAAFAATIREDALADVNSAEILKEVLKKVQADDIQGADSATHFAAKKAVKAEKERIIREKRLAAAKASKEEQERAEEELRVEEEKLRLEEEERLRLIEEEEKRKFEELMESQRAEREEEEKRLRLEAEARKGGRKSRQSARFAMAALKVVAKRNPAPDSPDWALVGPDPKFLPLIGTGRDGIEGMQVVARFHEEQVMYGLLRVRTGYGKAKRNKLVFLHIVGDSVGAVKRGKMNSVKNLMDLRMKEIGNITCALPQCSTDEMEQESVDDLIAKAGASDNDIEAELAKGGVSLAEGARKAAMNREKDWQKKMKGDYSEAAEAGAMDDGQEAGDDGEGWVWAWEGGEEEAPVEEEVAMPPNYDKNIQDILDLMYANKDSDDPTHCNWALFAPR